jgi:hypothetical protein
MLPFLVSLLFTFYIQVVLILKKNSGAKGLTVLVVSILITCAAQRSICDFINFTIFSFLIKVSNNITKL